MLAKFNSNGFWRTLYKVGFLRRYLHRVAGKKLLKLFGGRLRFLGIGGAKLDGGAEKFLLEAKVPYAIGYGLTETAPLLAGAAPSQVRLGSTGPQAPGVQLRLEHINPASCSGISRTPRRRKRSLPMTAGSARAIWASSTRTAGFISRGA